MRKLCRNRRGLSTVISTILMILVVMVGMSLLFAYVAVYAQNYKEGIGGAVMESLTIEDVWVQGSSSVRVSVYNAATKANMGSDVDVKVATIYVDGIALINVRGNTDPNSPNYNPNHDTINFNEQLVKAGMHIAFTCESSESIGSGTHDITIATIRGSNFKAQFYVP